VQTQLQINAGSAAKRGPPCCQDLVARVEAETLYAEVALVRKGLEVVLERGHPVHVDRGPKVKRREVLQNGRECLRRHHSQDGLHGGTDVFLPQRGRGDLRGTLQVRSGPRTLRVMDLVGFGSLRFAGLQRCLPVSAEVSRTACESSTKVAAFARQRVVHGRAVALLGRTQESQRVGQAGGGGEIGRGPVVREKVIRRRRRPGAVGVVEEKPARLPEDAEEPRVVVPVGAAQRGRVTNRDLRDLGPAEHDVGAPGIRHEASVPATVGADEGGQDDVGFGPLRAIDSLDRNV
jgi:hypothetical protein